MMAVMFVVMIFSVNNCRNAVMRMDVSKKQTEHNIKVGRDTVRITVNKQGFTEFDKLAYVGQIKDLYSINADLASELEKQKGKISDLTKVIVDYRTDSVRLANRLLRYADGRYGLAFTYASRDSGSVQNIEGVSRFKLDQVGAIVPDYTVLTKNTLELNVTLGHRKVENGYEFFATSKSPNFILKNAQSFVAVPAPVLPKRFGLGFQLGYGLSVYGNDVKLSPNISVGLNYNLIRF